MCYCCTLCVAEQNYSTDIVLEASVTNLITSGTAGHHTSNLEAI